MKNSIKKGKEFKNIYEEKRTFATKNMVLFISKNSDLESNRYGISVSRKVGNSVIRHTLARRIREVYRKNEEKLLKGIEMIVVLRVGSDKVKFSELDEDFLMLCKKHGIIKKED